MSKTSSKNSVTVSILMPVYNCEKYVEEAVESMLSQSFADFELILLDDCSTDNTAEVVKRFSDNRIIYHNNEKNLGLANNLNVGLKLAKGTYIARMDGDDISLPERLQTQVDFLESHPDIDLCSCALQMFGQEETIWIRETDPEEVKITMMFYSPILHATSVWRKDSFEKHNLSYDQKMFPAEDYDLWSRAVFYCKLVNIPQVLYKYRIHGVQVTKMDDRTQQKDREIKEIYLKRALPELDDKTIDDFVDKFITKAVASRIDLRQLKYLYKKVLQANTKSRFFNQAYLERRLKRYYQGIVFDKMVTVPYSVSSLKLLGELRLKQVAKLVFKKKKNNV